MFMDYLFLFLPLGAKQSLRRSVAICWSLPYHPLCTPTHTGSQFILLILINTWCFFYLHCKILWISSFAHFFFLFIHNTFIPRILCAKFLDLFNLKHSENSVIC